MNEEKNREQYLRHKFVNRLFPELLAEDVLTIPNVPTFECDVTDGVGAYVYGPSWAGKTVSVAASVYEMSREHRLRPDNVEFVVVPDLFREMKRSFDTPGVSTYDVEQKYRECRLLVLDDIGTRPPSDWAYDLLYGIINHRVNHKLPIIYTSNLSLDELEEIYDSRITTRIERSCEIIEKEPWTPVENDT